STVAKKLSKKAVREIRARFQREKPTAEQLVASGEIEPPVLRAAFLAARRAATRLKRWRQEAGLGPSPGAAKAGVDKGPLSRLESGVSSNPTRDVLARWALALARALTPDFPEPEPFPAKAEPKKESEPKKGSGVFSEVV